MSAAWCDRAAALLGAGLNPKRVVEILGEPPETEAGALRAAWQLCIQLGAPLGAVLSALAHSARDWERIARERRTALSGPQAAARLVLALPLVSLGAGALFGLNTIGFLFTTVLGWGLLVLGGALLVLALRWNRRLLRRAAKADPAPGFVCELSAQLLAAGINPAQTVDRVDRAWPDAGGADRAARQAALELAVATGMPPVRALRAEAAAQRAEAAAQCEQQAAELAVRLTLPLGLCVLPAFVCWGVLPVLLTLLGSTASSLR